MDAGAFVGKIMTNENGDYDDPVIWECDLVLNNSFPLRVGDFDKSTEDLKEGKQLLLTKMSSSTEHLMSSGKVVSGELKASSRKISLNIKSNISSNDVWNISGNALHISPHTQYYIAAFEKGMKKMLMSTPHSIFSIQPTLAHIDEEDAKNRILAKPTSPTATTTTATSNQSTPDLKAVHMQFRKKETEEQQNIRLCSHAHLNRLVDEEIGESFEYIKDSHSHSLFLKEKELTNSHK